FPGPAAIRAYAVDRCSADFAAYVGIDADTSKYDHVAISTITAESWAQGDHSILCYLVSDDGQAVTGSAKGPQTWATHSFARAPTLRRSRCKSSQSRRCDRLP